MSIIKSIILLLTFSLLLSGCVTQMAVGIVTTAISIPFQVAGQISKATLDED